MVHAVICAQCRRTLRGRFTSSLVAMRTALRLGWAGNGLLIPGARLVVGMTCGDCKRLSERRTVRPKRENIH